MIKDRLKEYLKLKRLSIRRFEQICGIGQSVLSKITEATSEDTLRKIEDNSDLNLDWLMTGQGQMLDPTRNMPIPSQTNIDGAQANAPLSTAIKDVKIDVTEQVPTSTTESKRKRQPSVSELQKEIARLIKLLSEANTQIAKLEGKVEQQNETIKMLIGK